MFNQSIVQIGTFIFLSCLVYGVTRVFRFQTAPQTLSNPKRSSILSMLAILIGVAIIASVFVLARLSSTSSAETPTTGEFRCTPSQIMNYAIFAVVLLAPSLFIIRGQREPLSSLGISSHNLAGSVSLGLLLVVVGIVVSLLISPADRSINLGRLRVDHAWGFLLYTIVGFSEEFLFRGYLQTRLIAWVGTWQGWLAASTIMALYHLPQRFGAQGLSLIDSLGSSLALLPISLFLGYLMLRTQNLMAPAIFHTFADWIGTLN